MEMSQHIKKQDQALVAKNVAVIYESPPIREHAVRFCECLNHDQKSALAEMNWWSFHLLNNPEIAADAAQKAAAAEVVIFAMHSAGDLPTEIKLWIETWLNKRGEREGALVGLLHNEDGLRDVASFREIYLRHIARRAGMDYLFQSAPTTAQAIPDSIDSFSERAGQVTSVLDDILRKRPRSPRS